MVDGLHVTMMFCDTHRMSHNVERFSHDLCTFETYRSGTFHHLRSAQGRYVATMQ
jgi:hypothetical protein